MYSNSKGLSPFKTLINQYIIAPVMIFLVSCLKSREKCSNPLYPSIAGVLRLGFKDSLQVVYGFQNSETSFGGFIFESSLTSLCLKTPFFFFSLFIMSFYCDKGKLTVLKIQLIYFGISFIGHIQHLKKNQTNYVPIKTHDVFLRWDNLGISQHCNFTVKTTYISLRKKFC